MPTKAKLIAALVSVALLVGGVILVLQRVYSHGYDAAKSKGDATLLQWQNDQGIADAEARKRVHNRYVAQVQRGNQAEQALIDTKKQLDQQKLRAKEQIDAVTQTYRTSLTAKPQALPQCVFTRGFVRMWNNTAGASNGSGAMQASSSTSGTVTTSQLDDALDSGVSQADVLDWFTDYAIRTRGIEAQLNKVLDVEQGNLQDQP